MCCTSIKLWVYFGSSTFQKYFTQRDDFITLILTTFSRTYVFHSRRNLVKIWCNKYGILLHNLIDKLPTLLVNYIFWINTFLLSFANGISSHFRLYFLLAQQREAAAVTKTLAITSWTELTKSVYHFFCRFKLIIHKHYPFLPVLTQSFVFIRVFISSSQNSTTVFSANSSILITCVNWSKLLL